MEVESGERRGEEASGLEGEARLEASLNQLGGTLSCAIREDMSIGTAMVAMMETTRRARGWKEDGKGRDRDRGGGIVNGNRERLLPADGSKFRFGFRPWPLSRNPILLALVGGSEGRNVAVASRTNTNTSPNWRARHATLAQTQTREANLVLSFTPFIEIPNDALYTGSVAVQQNVHTHTHDQSSRVRPRRSNVSAVVARSISADTGLQHDVSVQSAKPKNTHTELADNDACCILLIRNSQQVSRRIVST
jgi:hypothetical protein